MDVAVEHWSASWPVLIGYVVLAAWHLAGLRGTLVRRRRRAPGVSYVREAALFQLGLAVIVLALVSPIGYLSDVYIWVRALQELLVAVVGPGLIVLGAPWAALPDPAGPGGRGCCPGLCSRSSPRTSFWLGWQLARPVRCGPRQRWHRAGRARQLHRGRGCCSGSS